MIDDSERDPTGSSDHRESRGGPPVASKAFIQLALDATVTGPGMRSEDPYEPGTELKIKGERGVFTYRHASVSRDGLVSLHLVGDHTFRAVRPEQVSLARKGRRGPAPTRRGAGKSAAGPFSERPGQE